MKKRIVALLLCCVMLLTLSPSLIATATADDETTPAQTEVTVSPAKANLPRNTPSISVPILRSAWERSAAPAGP